VQGVPAGQPTSVRVRHRRECVTWVIGPDPVAVNATRELSRTALIVRGMNILLDCTWCGDEVAFTVDEADDELVCPACNTRTAFAPDPSTTFALLYEPAAAQAA